MYIDPWQLPEDSPSAEVILISHEHHDHWSLPDIERVRDSNSRITAIPRAASLIGAGTQSIRPWEGAIIIA